MLARHPAVRHAIIVWSVIITFLTLSLCPSSGEAALIGSRLSDGQAISQRQAQIDTIRQALEQEIVAQKLADFGLSVAEIEAKLPSLSDAQIHQLAGLSNDLAAGGVLGTVIAVLLIVLLVVVILKISGKEIIIR